MYKTILNILERVMAFIAGALFIFYCFEQNNVVFVVAVVLALVFWYLNASKAKKQTVTTTA